MWILPSRSCWQEWHLLWSSAAIDQAQFDVGSALLHTLDVKHRYLIYCWQLKEVWPLSFGLSHQQGIFISSLFFGHSLSALKMSVWINPSRSAAHLTSHPCHRQSHLNHLSSNAQFELQQNIFTMSTDLNALGCWHGIGWLDISINKQMTSCT